MEHTQVFMPTGQHSIICHIFRLQGTYQSPSGWYSKKYWNRNGFYLCQTNGWELID